MAENRTVAAFPLPPDYYNEFSIETIRLMEPPPIPEEHITVSIFGGTNLRRDGQWTLPCIDENSSLLDVTASWEAQKNEALDIVAKVKKTLNESHNLLQDILVNPEPSTAGKTIPALSL